MRKDAVALAVVAFVAIACAPSEPQAGPKQCSWYPGTCKDGAIIAPVDPTCLDEAICDDLGRKYTEATWPKTAEEYALACERYMRQHGVRTDELCTE